MNGNTTANVFARALAGEPSGAASAWGKVILRVGVGSMIFYRSLRGKSSAVSHPRLPTRPSSRASF
jgi:hypothetical protein